jgi:hypothetical protein
MKASRIARSASTVLALLAVFPVNQAWSQTGGQTHWPDEFGRQLAERIVHEAKGKLGTAKGPIEVTVKFTVTPYGPPIQKPTWTPEDVKNFDVCAQICGSWGCYINCSAPKVNISTVLPPKNPCDAIRAKYTAELVAANCLAATPGKR